jgi:Rv0078B-related antitoxin
MAAADAEKFRVVFDMCEAGVQMYRQRMRREAPQASDEEAQWRGGRSPTAAIPERLIVYLQVASPHWLNSYLNRSAACFPSVFLVIRTKLARHA